MQWEPQFPENEWNNDALYVNKFFVSILKAHTFYPYFYLGVKLQLKGLKEPLGITVGAP